MKKYERKKVEVQCYYCETLFSKDESEVKRNLALDRKNYCSRKCLGQVNKLHVPVYTDTSHLNAANRRDQFTGFREHLNRVKKRNKDYNISLEDLKEQWDKQNGKCAYSNVDLIHPKQKDNSHIYTASLDRIDSSLGYVKGNIQFVSIALNHMKSSMNELELNELLQILKKLS